MSKAKAPTLVEQFDDAVARGRRDGKRREVGTITKDQLLAFAAKASRVIEAEMSQPLPDMSLVHMLEDALRVGRALAVNTDTIGEMGK